MRLGMFPGQQEMFRRAIAIAREQGEARANRRAFLIAGGALVVGGAVGLGVAPWALGVSHEQPEQAEPVAADRELALLHRIAVGPLDQLESVAPNMTARIELHGGDDRLWLGYERLLLLALAMRDRVALARDLAAMASARAVPDRLRPLLARLREMYG